MSDKHARLVRIVVGLLAVLAYGSTSSAQQASAPLAVQETKQVTLKSNSTDVVAVECPEGTKVMGGGGGSDIVGASHFAIAWSMPITGQAKDGWTVGIVNRALTSRKGVISAFALCGKFQ